MKKFLNTLFVTTQGAYLNKEGESVVVSIEKTVRLRVPIHTLGGIVCFGNVLCSPFLMAHCAQNQVLISFLTENGRFLARVTGKVSGNVRLRRAQYRMADDEAIRLTLAKTFVCAKIANARTVLQRALRDHADKLEDDPFTPVILRLSRVIDAVRSVDNMESLRGCEGDAGREYFGVFDHMITAGKPELSFSARNRRPPTDPVNALLSFIYVLLAHDCAGALEAVGLDPQVGFLHSDRPGRAGLALDLMEEFRPFFADRLVLSLINLKQINARGFTSTESGAVEMNDATRKEVLTAYQSRKQDELRHPYLNEPVPIGMLMFAQALLMARYIRGDLDGYPAFFWR
ncbi:MAG: type I-C CRISPR-associated endonuclease Cas1 [Spartobacteria bacterium]|nr:type I-C CRISPR-associated endonuclease Cas1 [Spartobacteria bacterium]